VIGWDDAIVGAGVIGLAHAYHLAMRGRSVIIVERGPQAHTASKFALKFLINISRSGKLPEFRSRRCFENAIYL
jgi:glycine/D-amino acid oxidase-like deaminating enzyme